MDADEIDVESIGAIGPAPAQLGSLVDCHIAALPTDVITLLGRRFLRAHYGFYTEHPRGICLIVQPDKTNNEVAGFIIGGAPVMRSEFVCKHLALFLYTVASRSIINSRVRRRFLGIAKNGLLVVLRKLRLAPHKRLKDSPIRSDPDVTVLLTMGTRPACRGKGYGKILLNAYEAECRRLGFAAAELMTRKDNAPANALYTAMGWRKIGTHNDFNHYRLTIAKDQ